MKRNTSELLRLARAAVRLADALAVPERERTKSTGYHRLHAEEELREAAIAYRKILADHDVRRIGYGERTLVPR